MPVTIKKVNGKYQVSTPNGIHSKHTTKTKALAQSRLLNALDHGFMPTHSVKSIRSWGPGVRRRQ